MGNNDKYYWMRLMKDFFTQRELKKLRKVAGGDTFTVIYLKIALLSTQNGGAIYFEQTEENIAEQIALDIDEDVDNVGITLNFMWKNDLIERIDENSYMLPKIVPLIGSETKAAERMRRLRAKSQRFVGDGNNVTEGCNNVQKDETLFYRDRDRERDRERRLNTENSEEYIRTSDIDSDTKRFLQGFQKRFSASFSRDDLSALRNSVRKNKQAIEIEFESMEVFYRTMLMRMDDIRKEKEIKNPVRFFFSGAFGEKKYLWDLTAAEESAGSGYHKKMIYSKPAAPVVPDLKSMN